MTAFDNTVTLNGVRYPVDTPPVKRTITQFPSKELQGREPEQQDHTLLSTWSLGDFSGGLGRYAYEVGGDTDKFWLSTLDTRWPGYLVTLPSIFTTAVGGAVTWIGETAGGWAIGVDPSTGNLVPIWYAADTYQVGSSYPTSSGFGTTFSSPMTTRAIAGISFITDCVRFGDYNYFACADSSYVPTHYRYVTALSGAPTATTSLTYYPQKFAVLGETLYAIAQASGDTKTMYIVACSTPNTTSPTWTVVTSFKREDVGTVWPVAFLVQGYSQNGLPCLYAGVGRNIYQIDPVRGVAQKIFTLPFIHVEGNQYYGVRACLWEKTQNLYVSQGYNLWEFSGSIKNIAPHADGDGLPHQKVATEAVPNWVQPIVDLVPRRSGLIAITLGAATDSGSTVLEWRGGGWHGLAVEGNVKYGRGLAIQDVVIWRRQTVGVSTNTALGGLYDQDTDQPVFTRDSGYLASSFSADGYLQTPLWNANFPIDYKTVVAAVARGGPGQASINLESFDSGYHAYVGSVSPFDVALDGLQEVLYTTAAGRAFKNVRAKIFLQKHSTDTTPYGLLKSIGIKYLLRPKILYGWQTTINLSQPFEARSPEAMRAELEALVEQQTLTTFTYGGEATRYVAVSALTEVGTVAANNPQTQLTLTLLEPRPNTGFV